MPNLNPTHQVSRLRMWLTALAFTAASLYAGNASDVTVRFVTKDQAPLSDFEFTLMRVISGKAPERSMFTTDAQGQCCLTAPTGGARYVINWEDSKHGNLSLLKGRQPLTLAAGKTVTIVVKDTSMFKGSICVSDQTRCKRLSSFCLDRNERFLACDQTDKCIRVISLDDKLVEVWKLDFTPQVVACRDNSSVLVAGGGKIALLNDRGQVQVAANLPDNTKSATAVSTSGKDTYVCVQVKTGYAIYRLDEQLQNPVQIVKGLRGCCGQMDFTVYDGSLYVAHNAAFKVEKYDRTGKLLSSFGKRDDGTPESFKGCCEPKNLFFDSQGNLYTAESGNCGVKKFTATGKYLEFVGTVSNIDGCVRVTIARTSDQRFFMLDTSHNFISPVVPGKANRS